MDLTAFVLSFAGSLLQDHLGVTSCPDLTSKLLWYPSAFPLCTVLYPCHTRMKYKLMPLQSCLSVLYCALLAAVSRWTGQELAICNSGCVHVAHRGKSGYKSEKAPAWAVFHVFSYHLKRWHVVVCKVLCQNQRAKAEPRLLRAAL